MRVVRVRELRGLQTWEKVFLCVIAVIVFAGLFGCGPQNPNAPTPITIVISNTQTQGGGGPTPSPSPGAGGELPPGSFIRIGMFGETCGAGVTPPSNGSRQIKAGCVASITATPKDSAGVDLPAAVHGPTIAWSVPAGSGTVNCLADSEPFNRTCRCVGLGVFTLQATVKNLTGTADFECIA